MSSISVIIPTFNRKDLLVKTLNNIFDQSLIPNEIIVVDDNSSDGTYEFLKLHYLDLVIVVKNKGKGPGAARNTGMQIAKGDFIKFFDSDDLMTRNMIECQYGTLINSDRGFVYSPYFFATEDSSGVWKQTEKAILNYYPFDKAKPLHYWMAVKNLFITIPGMMFKKPLLNEVGPWRTDVTASEDWDYLWRISMIEPSPIHTNQCAFLYRVHGNQTTDGHLNHSQREHDKYCVLMDIYKRDVIRSTKITKWEKFAFENKFYQMSRLISEHDSILFKELKHFRTSFNDLLWVLIRLDQKIGRIKTKSNWQTCHGPLNSKDKFLDYLSMII